MRQSTARFFAGEMGFRAVAHGIDTVEAECPFWVTNSPQHLASCDRNDDDR